MQIVYKPFIDHTALIVSVEDDLDGTVKLHMTVKGKPALITMSVAEAALLFREFRKLNVEALARIHNA